MALLDAVALLTCVWLLMGRLHVIVSLGERLVLTVFGFGLFKSLEMLALLAIGWHPGLTAQTILSVGALGGVGVWVMSRRPTELQQTPAVRTAPVSFLWALGGVIGLLSGVAWWLNAWYPVTAPDGIWYQVRAWDFVHARALEGPHATAVFSQYPPLVPLLFAWLYTAGCDAEKALFPIVYLGITLLIFYRVRDSSRNERLAGWMALIWATTPYVWWHSLLGLLNLVTGAAFALGGLYWYALVQRRVQDSPMGPDWPWAVLSGMGFGAAAWTRPEMVLYNAVPLVLLMAVFLRFPRRAGTSDGVLVFAFALPALGWPLLWCAVLLLKIPVLLTTAWAMVAVTLLQVAVCGAWALGWFRASTSALAALALLAAGATSAVLWWVPTATLSTAGALGMGLFRTVGFHVFFAFTFLLWALAFTVRWRLLDRAARALLIFLGLYLLVHLGLYSLLPALSPGSVQVFTSPLIAPGDAVNSPDTREYLAWYPVFLLWVAQLPKVRRAFDHE